MDISIIICTWNRATLLDRTLTELAKLEIGIGIQHEVLVVNNRCTDATDEVLKRHEDLGRIPLVRLYEEQQGLSYARNCGLNHARGKLLLWTDDDVLVSPLWMSSYHHAASAYPAAQFFGGPVEPWFAGEPPRWMRRHWGYLRRMFAVTSADDRLRPYHEGEYPFGANMAFRAEIQRRYPYPVDRGRNPWNLLGGEETAVFTQIRDNDGYGVWVGSARVQHYLDAHRLNLKYIQAFSHAEGLAFARDQSLGPSPLWRGRPRWLWRRYFGALGRRFRHAPFRNRTWMEAVVDGAKFRGILDGLDPTHHPIPAVRPDLDMGG